jgi:DNA-binding transcriptional LysR family regulator
MPRGRTAAVERLRIRFAKLHTAKMFEWDNVKYFLAFAHAGSMQAAAKALHVNQSTVQRRIAELERRVGRQLIKRQLGGYRLTKLGEKLRPAAEGVDAAMAAFERILAASGEDLTGTVRVTCGSILANRLQRTSLIDAFHARYPGLKVELVISDRFLDLSRGEADIAIRAGTPQDQALVGRKIAEAPWAVYASREYVQHHGRPERPEDINQHSVVACGDSIAHYAGARWLQAVAPRATIVTRSDNWPGLVLAVKSGAGLAALLAFQGESENDLVCVMDDIDLVTPYYLLMHRDMQKTPRVRAFADFVASEIKSFRSLLLSGE